MSNFTTFFPSAGGGGGEGSGINSYAPFLVGQVDNDPQGYIASTGVYTNPVDSSVWLKTGSTLAVDGTYPNATQGGISYAGTGNNFITSNTVRGIVWNGTNFITIDASNNTVIELTEAGVATGNSWSYSGNGNDDARGLTFDGTHYYMGDSDLEVRKYTSSFGTAVSSFTASSITNFLDLTILNGSIYVQEGSYTPKRIRIFNAAGTETGDWTYTTPSSPYRGIETDGTNIWIAGLQDGTNDGLFEFTSAGVSTGGFIKTTAQTSFPEFPTYVNGAWRIRFGSNANAPFGLWEATYGDATARTDSSGSGQPLFIKLK
tara:strand:+ start:36 stop:986 length:951 start_codon:yes stop_codon:yes gene_type:complete